jgi:hypothetical protein
MTISAAELQVHAVEAFHHIIVALPARRLGIDQNEFVVAPTEHAK